MKSTQKTVTIIPELLPDKMYSVNDKLLSGKEIMNEGIDIELPGWEDTNGHMFRVELTQVV